MSPSSRNLAAILLVIIVAGAVACTWTAVGEDRHMREQLLKQARIAAVGIPVDHVTALSGSEADLLLPEYQALKAHLADLPVADPDVRFAYLFGRRDSGTLFFYADSEPADSPDYSPPGQDYPEVTEGLTRAFTEGIPVTEGPDTDRWGTWVSSEVPLADPATGKTVAVFGIDVDARYWYWQILMACITPLAATILVLVLVLFIFSVQRRMNLEREKDRLFIRTQQALAGMARLPAGDTGELFRRIAELDARTIGADRVSIWMFNSDHSAITCLECYTPSPEETASGMQLARANYPRYFQALDEDRIIAADYAMTDERTREFARSYLMPLGIVSMLDVPIRRGGQTVGIICHEYKGSEKTWDPLEQDFAASAADLVASALERGDRIAAEEALAESERRYRGVVDDQTELIMRFLPDRTLVFVNAAYCRFFDVTEKSILRTLLPASLLGDDRSRFDTLLGTITPESPVGSITIRIQTNGESRRWLSWVIRGIFSDSGSVAEYQAVGRDVTWQKQMEDSLAQTNRKLNLLSSITRHDVLNQIIILKGFLQLGRRARGDPKKFEGYMEKTTRALATIEAQITFTQVFQDMGSIAPSWQDVTLCIIRAKGALPMADIRAELHRPGLEIFADPLLEKVFFNLFDNALRYGGEKMTRIRVTSAERPEGLVITCEDDGVGISTEDKACLFRQGFGKHTGFGLFLSREILNVSGITIIENGVPGAGARFEITVPAGSYRFNGHTTGR